MSSSDRKKRSEERAARARRAQRLAEREAQRAKRRAAGAVDAAERAEELARKASRRSRRNRERSIEDYVDALTEKWERKAESWFETRNGRDDLDDDLHDASTASAARRARVKESEESGMASGNGSRRTRRPRRTSRRRPRRSFRSRLSSGRGLYRDKEHRKICGVCAGMAEYLDVDTWQVRLVAVLGLIFVPSVAVPVYFILYFLMDDKPYYRRVTDRYEASDADEMDTQEVQEPMVSPGKSKRDRAPEMNNAEALRTAKNKFADIETRLRSMESHVTSSKFELQRELKKIAGDEL